MDRDLPADIQSSDETHDETTFVDPATLALDLENPRMPDARFSSEREAINYLIDNADVNELVQSIGRSGWLDFEPLIVLPTNTVIEGNRRLAAIKLLVDPTLREELSFKLPVGVSGAAPTRVRVRYVQSRSDARAYIGFKHINGAFKWDSFAKARYATAWLDDEPDIGLERISEQLGDGHSTVLRLVNGYRVLRQAEDAGFNIDEITAKRGFSFSHLYTALPYAAVRKFLGLVEPPNATLPTSPVPKTRVEHLLEYMTWLYGQKGKADPVVRSQNPDLVRLARVLDSASATRMLRVSNDLDEAYETVEDKAEIFASSVYSLLKLAREASKNLGYYDGDPEVLTVVKQVVTAVNRLHRGMSETPDSERSVEETDAAVSS